MDTIFDKLGVYDFWGTFFPGLMGMITLEICGLNFINIGNEETIGYTLIIFVSISYLLGIILHEIGHFIQDKLIYKFIYKGEPCDNFLLNKSIFKDNEKKAFLELYKKWATKNQLSTEPNKETCRLFFNYCDYYINKKNRQIKSDKMQSIYGMSRSLFVFFGVLTIYELFKLQWFIFGVSLILLVTFYFRTIRFNEIRLKVVMRTYLVESQKNK